MSFLKFFNFANLTEPLRIALAQKLFLGYMIMVGLTLLVGGYALFQLNTLRGISEGMVNQDFPLAESVDNMEASLLAQNLYEKRFTVIRNPAVKSLFEDRGVEFREDLENYRKNLPDDLGEARMIEDLHRNYESYVKNKMDLLGRGEEQKAVSLSNDFIKRSFEDLIKTLSGITQGLKQKQGEKILETNQVGKKAFYVTIFLCFLSGVFGFGFATFLIYNLTSSIRKLKEATRFIGEGKFDRVSSIPQTKDEVGDLAESFQWMTNRLKTIGEVNLDANPLTRLPGNLVIEKVILTRLQGESRFAFCLVDLDNFKAFSDRYGYSRGSDVLKAVGNILVDTVKRLGHPNDFVGHIGGDDFVLVTDIESIAMLCEAVIDAFDEQITRFYDPDDVKKGFIISKDRKDIVQAFPIMTISIAVVTNKKKPLSSPAQIAEKAAQLKHYAKTFPKSLYVVDQRRSQ